MHKKVEELNLCFHGLFGYDLYEQCYIDVIDKDEIVLSANKEGLLLLIEELINLCKKDRIGDHYHLDEAGMANKCDKPMVIQLIKAPWQKK